MQEASGARARRPRPSRGEVTYGGEEDGPSRVAELERERAGLEMFAGVAAHELVAPLIAAETRARLIAEQLDDRVEGDPRGDLDELLRTLLRMRVLVETLLQDARSSGVSLEWTAVNLDRLARDSVASLRDEVRARDARVVTEDLPVVRGDGVLL